jgi:hypothetical protein
MHSAFLDFDDPAFCLAASSRVRSFVVFIPVIILWMKADAAGSIAHVAELNLAVLTKRACAIVG